MPLESDLNIVEVSDMEKKDEDQSMPRQETPYAVFNSIADRMTQGLISSTKQHSKHLSVFVEPVRAKVENVESSCSAWWPRWRLLLFILTLILSLLLVCLLISQQVHVAQREAYLRRECTHPYCLESSAVIQRRRNNSVSPCENFYKYACGLYFDTDKVVQDIHPPSASEQTAFVQSSSLNYASFMNHGQWADLLRSERPALSHMAALNVRAMMTALDELSWEHDWSNQTAKTKAALWYRTCRRKNLKHKYVNFDFLESLFQSSGGCWLLDKMASKETGANTTSDGVSKWKEKLFRFWFNQSTINMTADWKWMESVKSLFTNFHVPIFVALTVESPPDGKPFVKFFPKFTRIYGRSSYWERTYTTNLVTLLARHAGIPEGDEEFSKRLKLFLDDISLMTQQLNKLYDDSGASASFDLSRVTLKDLNGIDALIDYKGLLNTYFDKSTIRFIDSYSVQVEGLGYLQGLSGMLKKMKENHTEPVFNRIINNYMIWNSLTEFAWHMSFEFSVLHSYYRNKRDYTPDMDCFNLAQGIFGPVLGGLYAQIHPMNDSLGHITEMLSHLNDSFQNLFQQTSWIDDETKNNLRHLVDGLKIHYEIPEEIQDERKMNTLYDKLEVSYNHLKNVVSSISYFRLMNNRKLQGDLDEKQDIWSERFVHVYDTKVAYHLPSKNIYIPNGMLQPPVYHQVYPNFVNFGVLGSIVGETLANFISLNGDENHMKLWSQLSKERLNERKLCVYNRVKNITMEFFDQIPWLHSEYWTHVGLRRADIEILIRQVSGLDVARTAFERWDWAYPTSHLPGIERETKKTFYTSFAQAFCSNLPIIDQVINFVYYDHTFPSQTIVNHVVSEVPDFADTFQCPSGSPMNPSRCSAAI